MRFGMNRRVLAGTLVTPLGMAGLALITLAGLSGPSEFFGFIVALGRGNGICLPKANAGMLSIRPELAGTASGLGGALVIGGGAALSALAVTLLPLGSGEMPLVLLMLGCALASAFAILPLTSPAQDLRDPGSLANTDQQE